MAVNKRKILAAAQKHLQKGALDKALREYQTLVKADPRDANSLLKLGDIQLRLGNREEAIEAYQKVAAQFMHDGFDAKAVAIYKQIAKIDSKRFDIYEPLAELYQRLGLASEALSALQTAADAHHRAGRKREALDLLRKMAGLDPTNTTSRLKVADLLRQADMSGEALAEYEQIAAELVRQGAEDDLPSVYERILEIEPGRVATLVAMARALIGQREFGRAEPYARRAVTADAECLEAYEALVEIFNGQRNEQALGKVYHRLAELYRKRGDEDRAREIAQRFVPEDLALDGQPPDFSAAGELAAAEFGGAELGSEDLGAGADDGEPLPPDEEPIELDTEAGAEELASDPEQLLAEASVYLRYGKADKAIEALEAVLAGSPEDRAALEKLGEARVAADDKSGAVEVWTRAAKVARAAGDEAAAELICERIAGLDPLAAAKLARPAGPAARRAAPAPPPQARAARAAPAPASDDLDLEIDIEVGGTSAAPAAEEPQAADAGAEDLDLDLDLSDGSGDAAPADDEQAALRGDPDDATASAALPRRAPGGEESTLGTSTSPQQISDEVEEADFYFNQELFEEAEIIYRRVLQVAPNHPQALLRLGEIAQARGEDPSAASGGAGVAGAAAAAPREAPREVPDAELGEDLAHWDDTEAELPEEQQGTGAELDADVEIDVDLDADDEPTPDAAPPPPVARGERRPPQRAHAEADQERDAAPAGEPTFDLAAELSDVFGDDEAADSAAAGVDDGFAAVFREFKKGVQETLSEGDYEAHYDLGIAYREMGLFDDALGEFKVAAASPERKLACLHMLGLCSLDLGRALAAVSHLEQALALGPVPVEQRAVLHFDLGRALEAAGDRGRARDAYRAVADVDPEFQDVAQRLAFLERPGNAGAGPPARERYETFDDLIAEAEAELAEAGEEEEEEPEPEEAPEEDARAEAPAAPARKRRRKISFL